MSVPPIRLQSKCHKPKPKPNRTVAFWSKKLVVGESAEVQPPEGYILNLQQASLVSNVKNSVLQLGVKTIAIEGEEVKKHDA